MSNNGQLQLQSGRHLYLRELRQWEVYEGLLEGLPTTEMNWRHIERIVAKSRDNPYSVEPLLIQPVEKPIEWDQERPYPFGKPAALPPIGCMARFDSLEPSRDPSKDASGLIVIWFQERFAFPIDPLVLEQLQSIDWERYAVDWEY